VYGNAKVYGEAYVYEDVKVYGDAKVDYDVESKNITESINKRKRDNTMKITKKVLHKLIKETKEEYQEFFNKTLKKFDVKSVAELDDNKKKEFFNYIEDN